jgi:hypothetical protein
MSLAEFCDTNWNTCRDEIRNTKMTDVMMLVLMRVIDGQHAKAASQFQ